VHLHHTLDQCQADAQAVSRPLERRIDLREHLKDAWKLLSGNAYTGVLHTDENLGALAFDAQPNAAARVGELARIVQQVTHDLPESARVGAQVRRLRRQRDRQLESRALAERADGFDGVTLRSIPVQPAPCEVRSCPG
jgi:hypothetical protein